MPEREVGRFYVYWQRDHRWREIDPQGPNGSDNDVLPLAALAAKVVGNPACFGKLLASPDVWYFFAIPEEVNGCDETKLERFALSRHIRLLESVRACLAEKIPRAHLHPPCA